MQTVKRNQSRSQKLARMGLWLGGLLLIAACEGRTRSPSDDGTPGLSGSGHVAIVNLYQGAAESPIGSGLFPQPSGQTFIGLLESLTEIEEDKRARSVFVDLRGRSFGFARSKEIGERLSRINKRIPVICHTHEIDNATLWLLSHGCSKVWLSAAGGVATVGIGAELSYLKGAFDKFGVQADMLAMGKYKSGAEALTRAGPSEASLNNLLNTLSDLRNEWHDGITIDRKEPEERVLLAEDGPWSPKRAKELGLVDHVGFSDQALKAAKKAGNTDKQKIAFGYGKSENQESPTAGLLRLLLGSGERSRGSDRIAVVPAVGGITMTSGGPFGGGEGITAAAMTKTLARLREDDAVRAVVMRMDSPGGSPLASDLIWREMMLTREKKPVIVSIGGMSASGGYYIACGATKIVASSTAIVGSIGVFGGKIVLGEAFGKLGITHFPVAASPEEGAAARANHMSPMTPWDDATRERVRDSMQRIYDLFVERVAEGRGMPTDRVYATAEGEIFLAPVGKERGLIDEIGGLDLALEIARKEGDLPQDIPVVVEGAAESILEALLLGPEPAASEVEAALRRYEERRMQSVAQWALGGNLEELRPFAAAISPLLAGESVVAALPYAIDIH